MTAFVMRMSIHVSNMPKQSDVGLAVLFQQSRDYLYLRITPYHSIHGWKTCAIRVLHRLRQMASSMTTDGDLRLFFDISALRDYVNHYSRYSGIQRVVVSLIVEVAKTLPAERIYLSWYDMATGQYCCTPFSEIGVDPFLSPDAIRRKFFPNPPKAQVLPPIEKYVNRKGKYAFHRMRYDILSWLGRDEKFRKFDMTAAQWRAARTQNVPRQFASPVSKIPIATIARPKDRLIMMDSSWLSQHSDAFSQVRAMGVEVFTMVHDLIPLKATSTCDISTVGPFYEWIYRAKDYTDHFLTVSKSTQRDLIEFLNAYDTKCPTSVVQLAQAPLVSGAQKMSLIDSVGPISSIVAQDTYPDFCDLLGVGNSIQQIMTTPYVLCVGTLEGRKNVWRVAMAWKTLLEQGNVDIPKLVFAGRMGWAIDDMIDFLEGTNFLNGAIRVVDGPSDQELDMLYRKCEFSILASLYEGWGLPVGEALAYGKTSVVGDNSALPEVGQDLVEYCDASRISSIVDAVLRLLDPEHRKIYEDRIAQTKLRGWDDVAADLLDIITAERIDKAA